METTSTSPMAAAASGGALTLLDDQAFLDLTARALAGCKEGRPSALVRLELVRAEDISQTCGSDAGLALSHLVQAVTYNQIGPDVPACQDERAGISLLFENVLPTDAATRASRLLGSLDEATFIWQSHPFRLGAHVGVVELGPEPYDAGSWVERAVRACDAARGLGGKGLQMVRWTDDAWRDLEREQAWHDHISEVM